MPTTATPPGFLVREAKTGRSLRYGPPPGVLVVSALARFEAMMSRRTRWAESPEALMSKESICHLLAATLLDDGPEQADAPGKRLLHGVVAKRVAGEEDHFAVHVNVVAVGARGRGTVLLGPERQ